MVELSSPSASPVPHMPGLSLAKGLKALIDKEATHLSPCRNIFCIVWFPQCAILFLVLI